MSQEQPKQITDLLISTEELCEFLDCGDTLARTLMQRLEIPKRGSGYPRMRLLAALGFPAFLPTNTPDIWRTLLDVPATALKTGESQKTIGRMFSGVHRDKSFTHYMHVGDRKRLIFPFEVEAWLTCEVPKFNRQIELMHPSLRATHYQPKTSTRRKAHTLRKSEATGSAAMFMPPKKAE